MIPPNDIERRLRAALDAHARNAPPGAPLAERVLIEIDAPVLRPRRGWRTWTAPLLAAAAIVAAALAIVGLNNAHVGAPPGPGATRALASTPVPQSTTTQPRPIQSTTSPPVVVPPVPVADTGGVHGFRASDITFDSRTEGWALGSAKCLNGEPGRCTEILHTTDGIHWPAAPTGENFNVPGVKGCADPCVMHLRFANSSTGYAYGPDVLFMTTDGGAHWTKQSGAAQGLETQRGNVIRLAGPCGAGCSLRAETAGIGSSAWTDSSLGTIRPFGAQLARNGDSAYILTQNESRGYPASVTQASLYVSTDDGQTWVARSDPCTKHDMGAYSIAGADGSLSLLCGGSSTTGQRVMTSNDAGASFGPGRVVHAPGAGYRLGMASAHDMFVAGDPGLYRSTDGGVTWARVDPQLREVTFIGFESATDGRALGDNGRAIWTTHDAGATWSEVRFPA